MHRMKTESHHTALTLSEGWWPGGSSAAQGGLQQRLQLVTAGSLLLNQIAVHHWTLSAQFWVASAALGRDSQRPQSTWTLCAWCSDVRSQLLEATTAPGLCWREHAYVLLLG